MDYSKRLLKFLKTYNGMFDAQQIASIWKRSASDVAYTATLLNAAGRVSIKKFGVLSLKRA